MTRILAALLLAMSLASCQTNGQPNPLAARDEASCRAHPEIRLEDCRKALAVARQQAAQDAALNGIGPGLQDAGKALQSIGGPPPAPMAPPPIPTTTQCRWQGQLYICQHF